MERIKNKIDVRFTKMVAKTSNLLHSYYAVNSIDGMKKKIKRLSRNWFGRLLDSLEVTMQRFMAKSYFQLKYFFEF